jgi:carbonic anhydrase
MHLEGILDHNRAFVRDRTPAPLPPPGKMDLAVVACYDPRLDGLLLPALGLSPGAAFLIRTGGALVRPSGGTLRNLGLAAFLFGVTEVIVVGHTSCRMAAFDTSAFIEAFRRRGVPREAFGPDDLRAWAGAIPDPRRGVQMSVAGILAAPFLPRDLSVAGLLLDDASGALEVVVSPGESPAVLAAPVTPSAPASVFHGVSAPGFPAPTAFAAPPPPPVEAARPGVPPAPASPGARTDPLADAVAEFVRTLESEAGLGREMRQLRQELDRQPNPLAKLNLLESFIRRASAGSREVAGAYQRLRQQVAASRRQWDPQELVKQFLALTRRP